MLTSSGANFAVMPDTLDRAAGVWPLPVPGLDGGVLDDGFVPWTA